MISKDGRWAMVKQWKKTNQTLREMPIFSKISSRKQRQQILFHELHKLINRIGGEEWRLSRNSGRSLQIQSLINELSGLYWSVKDLAHRHWPDFRVFYWFYSAWTSRAALTGTKAAQDAQLDPQRRRFDAVEHGAVGSRGVEGSRN